MARKHDREFKLEAVRLAQEEGTTATEVERRLGIGTMPPAEFEQLHHDHQRAPAMVAGLN